MQDDLDMHVYKNLLWHPSKPVKFIQFLRFFVNLPPVVAMRTVNRLSSI